MIVDRPIIIGIAIAEKKVLIMKLYQEGIQSIIHYLSKNQEFKLVYFKDAQIINDPIEVIKI